MAPKLRVLPLCTFCGGPQKGKGKGYCVNAACRDARRRPQIVDVEKSDTEDKEQKDKADDAHSDMVEILSLWETVAQEVPSPPPAPELLPAPPVAAATRPSGDEAEIRNHATEIRPRLQEGRVAGDGNCLFRAIAAQMPQGEEYHPELRRLAVRHVALRRDRYYPVLMVDGFDNWLRRMARDREWSDNAVVQAIANRVSLCILVWRADLPDQRPTLVNSHDHAADQYVYLMLHEEEGAEHYNPLTVVVDTRDDAERVETLADDSDVPVDKTDRVDEKPLRRADPRRDRRSAKRKAFSDKTQSAKKKATADTTQSANKKAKANSSQSARMKQKAYSTQSAKKKAKADTSQSARMKQKAYSSQSAKKKAKADTSQSARMKQKAYSSQSAKKKAKADTSQSARMKQKAYSSQSAKKKAKADTSQSARMKQKAYSSQSAKKKAKADTSQSALRKSLSDSRKSAKSKAKTNARPSAIRKAVGKPGCTRGDWLEEHRREFRLARGEPDLLTAFSKDDDDHNDYYKWLREGSWQYCDLCGLRRWVASIRVARAAVWPAVRRCYPKCTTCRYTTPEETIGLQSCGVSTKKSARNWRFSPSTSTTASGAVDGHR